MPDILWIVVDKEKLKSKETVLLEWTHCTRSNPLQWGCPEDMHFTALIRYKMMTGTKANLKCIVVILPFVLDLRVRNTAAYLE